MDDAVSDYPFRTSDEEVPHCDTSKPWEAMAAKGEYQEAMLARWGYKPSGPIRSSCREKITQFGRRTIQVSIEFDQMTKEEIRQFWKAHDAYIESCLAPTEKKPSFWRRLLKTLCLT